MKCTIVEARPYHCGQMARLLRAEHHAILLRLGVGIHRDLRAVFIASGWRRAWLIDGRLAGLGGVVGTMLSGEGMIWLALTDQATRHPAAVLRESRRQMNEIMATRHRVVTAVLLDDEPALRFAVRLGFEDSGERMDGAMIMARRAAWQEAA